MRWRARARPLKCGTETFPSRFTRTTILKLLSISQMKALPILIMLVNISI